MLTVGLFRLSGALSALSGGLLAGLIASLVLHSEFHALNRQVVELAKTGKAGEAIQLAEKTLELVEQSHFRVSPLVGASLNNLAWLHMSQGRYATAENLFRRSISVREKTLGQDHQKVSDTVANLAHIYRLQGRHSKAEPLFLRILDVPSRMITLTLGARPFSWHVRF